jgi:capsular polysaccharide biosynthesis protein
MSHFQSLATDNSDSDDGALERLEAQGWTVRAEPGVDRVATIWRAKYLIGAAAILVAILTYGICLFVPRVYAASSTVEVSLPPPGAASLASQATTAAGDLAGQYAQLATLSPVLSIALKSAGTSEAVLANSVSAGTISGENLISVRAQAGSASAATRWANAVGAALTEKITSDNDAQVASYEQSVDKQLQPVNQQISSVTAAIATERPGSAALSPSQALLASLLTQRAQVLSASAQNAADVASASLVAPAGAGSQIQPRPTLYATVAFVVMLLAGAQIAVAVESYRRRR